METMTSTYSSADLIKIEDRYGAHNYHPLPVVLSRGEGVHASLFLVSSKSNLILETSACLACAKAGNPLMLIPTKRGK